MEVFAWVFEESARTDFDSAGKTREIYRNERGEVQAINPSCAEVTTELNQRNIGDADGGLRDSKAVFAPPTPEEVSRLTCGELRDIRIHAQELRNQFSHLLNRGSSLE